MPTREQILSYTNLFGLKYRIERETIRMSIGVSSISEMPVGAQDDPNSKKTAPGQTAPLTAALATDPAAPTDSTAVNDPTAPSS